MKLRNAVLYTDDIEKSKGFYAKFTFKPESIADESPEEILDLVDLNDNVIGTVSRKAAHTNKAFAHRGTALIIVNSNSQVLMCKRAMTKPTNPGIWTVASSGHVQAGQNPMVAVAEEAHEELGIEVEPIFVQKEWEYEQNETMVYYVCYAFYDGDDITLDPEEMSEYRWIRYDDFEVFCEENEIGAVTLRLTKKVINSIDK